MEITFNQELWNKLTPREVEIIRLSAQGQGCKGIAERLDSTERGIQASRHHLIKKVQAGNMPQVVYMATKGGII